MAGTTQTWRQQLEQAARAWRDSPLPGFLSWWRRELLACLPQRARAWFERGPQWRLLVPHDDRLLLRDPQAADILAEIDPDQDADLQRAGLHEACADVDADDLRLALCLPASITLRRRLLLPQAARSRLRQVVSYEMDRQTPFRADQVYAEVRELPEPVPGGRIAVELVAVPKAQVEPWLERAQALSGGLDAVDVLDAEGRCLGLNLLPSAARRRRHHRRRTLNRALAALLLLLTFAGMQAWLHNRRAALAATQAQVDALHTRARAVAALRHQLDDRLGAVGFLAKRRAATPAMLALLDDLSRRLPKDTWLNRISLGNGRLGMQGESPHAAHLIDLLKASPLLTEPGFQGVIQTDPGTGSERFYIVAHVHAASSAKGHGGAHAAGTH